MEYTDRILEYFKEITKIPRESGHEERMREYLIRFAHSKGLECRTDAAGNVCIVKEASQGKENVPVLVLQGHQDMVCEKAAGSTHDFLTDPISYVIEDGWMIAKETTLGADDGIGVAAMLMILDGNLKTGKIECVFTTSEETGMDGAFGMEKGFFTGKTLINLDSEDEGQLFIGCAGGVDTTASFTFRDEQQSPDYQVLKISVSNGLGGHSGDEINKGRMNAIKVLSTFLSTEYSYGLQLISIDGGNKPNAIPRECNAVVAVPDIEATRSRFATYAKSVAPEYSGTDPGVRFEAVPAYSDSPAICAEVASACLEALAGCPHGVIEMSRDIEGLVETSTNLASVKMPGNGSIIVVTSQRSSVTASREEIAARVESCFSSRGASVEHHSEYPGWKPNPDSAILRKCVESYRKLFGTDPQVKAIHAGLECGLFEEKFGGLDMISFGPTLCGVHAPGERLDLASLERFTAHLADVITNLE
ncbi:MAG: aminoacyl-histidine dipeptidase [Candidatus Cryptobacteroides sp.]